jgi:ribosome biogenesis GTPase
VRKSTLINRLIGRDAQRVQEVREDGKGRHTKTRRELIVWPGGGLVLDTPGLRELQLWDGAAGIAPAFVEVEDLAASCRFADCAHESEPGCVVLAAVADGRLPSGRLDGYRKLHGTHSGTTSKVPVDSMTIPPAHHTSMSRPDEVVGRVPFECL